MPKYEPLPPAHPERPIIAIGVNDVIAVEDPHAQGTLRRISARGKWARELVIPDGVAELIRELGEHYNIVWASEWGPNAHYAFENVLGLPHEPWPYLPVQFDKLNTIVRYSKDAPWIWIDSPLVDLSALPESPGGMIIRVDPEKGLQRSDVDFLLTA
ncbi:hypothetical protein GCM10022381_25570 [Leifsonia kafniensis]|uniref:Uncharacterized protein n=1 Tax=Leifsonia kafniensis TaxID=475957 RepID=A0ABP7KMS7_9MICO